MIKLLGRTHVAFGILAGALLHPYLGGDPYLFYLLVGIGALLPDVDHHGSTINRMVPVTKILPLFFKHRGFFHSVFPGLLLLALAWYSSRSYLGIPLAVGYFAHLASDALTVMGVNFVYPFSQFTLKGPLRTGTAQENAAFFMCWGATLTLFFLRW